MSASTDELLAKMRLNAEGLSTNSYSPSPGGSLSSRPARPRPSLGLGGGADSFNLGSPMTRRQTPGSLNLSAPLARDRPKFIGTFPQPSQDEYERKMEEIMKISGLLNIDGGKYHTPIEDLIPLGDLGNGTCGHVVKMRHNETGKIVACKQMRRTGNSEETKRIVMDMDVVLKSHDCQEIVVCLGCFITASDVWICMELMATCFDKLLKMLKSPVPENICGKVAVATLNALNYLKDKHGVIHRDVKPSNILLDYEGKVKLCDFGISGRLVDSKAKTRSAGCAAYMAPERINPPNPNKPDYDIRADVWSLGITLVELATGEFPYKDCKTEFEVLTKVIQEDPPCLPPNQGFSTEFRAFVHDCLLKNHKDRPKYKKLLEHPFINKYREMEVDVGAWYSKVSNHSGDPNKVSEAPATSASLTRKSSLEQRHESQIFKPQPSPRMVKSWRQNPSTINSGSGTEEAVKVSSSVSQEGSLSRLKFYKTSPASDTESYQRKTGHLDDQASPRGIGHPDSGHTTSPRFDNSRLHDLTSKSGSGSTSHRYPEVGGSVGAARYDTRAAYMDSSRLNGSLGRNNFTSSYHGSPATNFLSRPSYSSSRSHEESFSSIKSPQSSRYEAAKLGSYSETNSPRDYSIGSHGGPSASSSATHRKYSIETLDPGREYHYTPKGTRKYREPALAGGREESVSHHSPRKFDSRLDSPRSLESQGGQTEPREVSGGLLNRRESGSGASGARKYPALPVPDPTTRGREQSREARNFIPSSWKSSFGSWTLSSPLNLRKFRTSSSDRASTFERSRRLQPGYRSLNERDKQYYSCSGKSSDNL